MTDREMKTGDIAACACVVIGVALGMLAPQNGHLCAAVGLSYASIWWACRLILGGDR